MTNAADSSLPVSPLSTVRAVLFDLDGTLLDSYQAHYRVYTHVFRDLHRDFDEAAYARHYSPNWYIFYERLGLPKELWAEADRLWLHYYAQEAPERREGADEVVAVVRASGRSLGLVTSGDRSRVERDVQRMGWERLFDVVVCGGDVRERKPHPAPLQHALQHLRTSPHAALYVGDTVEDVAMGQAAGVMTGAVLGGFSSPEVFQQVVPDVVLGSLHDLVVLLSESASSLASPLEPLEPNN